MSADLADLTPDTGALAKELLRLAALEGVELAVVSTRRTCAVQNGIYAEGRTTPGTIRTNARGCQSWHVVGRAFDVAVVHGPKNWQEIGALGKSIGLVWGGDFRGASASLHDYGHFEYHPGLSIEDVCPNPDACTDDLSVPAPETDRSVPTTDWMSTCPTASCSPCGPRLRYLSDGHFELEGLGVVTEHLPAWVETYRAEIYAASRATGLPPNVIAAVCGVEYSRGNPRACSGDPKVTGAKNGACPEGATCTCVAYGPMQVTMDTATRNLGHVPKQDELFDAAKNVLLGSTIFRHLLDHFHGNLVLAAFAYNAGGPYCGVGHRHEVIACDPNGDVPCEHCKDTGCPNPPCCTRTVKSECLPANRFNIVADCHRAPDGSFFTFDYGYHVVAMANGALPAWAPDAEPRPEPAPPPGPGPGPTPPPKPRPAASSTGIAAAAIGIGLAIAAGVAIYEASQSEISR